MIEFQKDINSIRSAESRSILVAWSPKVHYQILIHQKHYCQTYTFVYEGETGQDKYKCCTDNEIQDA